MTSDRFDLSRRKVLGSVGTVGGAAALGGMGTMAFFSDEEEFANNQLVSGELDMKVGYSAHYSDWSEDEDGSHTDSTDDDVDVRMWDGPPGTTGGSSDLMAGETGLPTNVAWLIAVDEPDQFLANTEYAADGTATCPGGTDAAAVDQPVISLDDVKPGDFGEVTFDFALCDNPGYVWLETLDAVAHENGTTEPEQKDDDEDAPGDDHGHQAVELLDVVQAAYWIDDGNNYQNGTEAPAAIGSLRDILNGLATSGARLNGDIDAKDGGGTGSQGCFSAGATHSLAFAWWVPVDHGNEIQSDSVSFSLNFYTEQCRHNDGTRNELTAFLNDDAVFKQSPIWDGHVENRTGVDEIEVAVGAKTSVDIPLPVSELPMAFDPMVVRVSPDTTVKWTWVKQPGFPPDPIPHTVTALDGSYDSHHRVPGDPDFIQTFSASDAGVNLYYCHPHGAPSFVQAPSASPVDEVLNEFGMRGAVIVE